MTRYFALIFVVFYVVLLASCTSNDAHSKETAIKTENESGKGSESVQTNADTLLKNKLAQTSSPNENADTVLSKMEEIVSFSGKNEVGPGALYSEQDVANSLSKLKSKLPPGVTNPGDAMASSILNFQLGQMSKDNPLKSVANGMLAAQKNGTAGVIPDYTAVFKPEQPVDFNVPESGNGNGIILRYDGGTSADGKKDGLWKIVSIDTKKAKGWNVFSDAFMESSVINMKVHATSLASLDQDYRIDLNEPYKKYFDQPDSELGKNEFDVHVQKMGPEVLFHFNCMHVKILYTIKALGQTSKTEDDEWYSDDVPGSKLLSPEIFESHSPDVIKKLIASGCNGALVKLMSKSKGGYQLIQLSSVMKKDLPDSLFLLPSGYEKDKNIALYDIQ